MLELTPSEMMALDKLLSNVSWDTLPSFMIKSAQSGYAKLHESVMANFARTVSDDEEE